MRLINYVSRSKIPGMVLSMLVLAAASTGSQAEILFQGGPQGPRGEAQEGRFRGDQGREHPGRGHDEGRDNPGRGVGPRDHPVVNEQRIEVRPPVVEMNRRPYVQPVYRSPYWDYDRRFEHNHYYPARGYRIDTLPPGYLNIIYGQDRFFFNAGVWFRNTGSRFVVVSPPLGIVVPILPPTYSTVWRGNRAYYYANDVYYALANDGSGYQVVLPPPEVITVNSAPVPESSRALYPGFNDGLMVYPRNGQGPAQTSAEHEACDRWALTQTNYNPSLQTPLPDQSQSRKDFERAVTVCLDARGYSVR